MGRGWDRICVSSPTSYICYIVTHLRAHREETTAMGRLIIAAALLALPCVAAAQSVEEQVAKRCWRRPRRCAPAPP